MREKTDFRPRDRWLTYAFVVGPLAALTHLTVMYTLAPTTCARGSRAMLHASTGAFLLVALTGALIAWRGAARFREAAGDVCRERTHWLAQAALALSIGSMVVIVAMELPNVILRSCQ